MKYQELRNTRVAIDLSLYIYNCHCFAMGLNNRKLRSRATTEGRKFKRALHQNKPNELAREQIIHPLAHLKNETKRGR